MKSFLETVAEHIIEKFGNNLAHTAVIFPNKRARLFFNDYLARKVDGPMWSPAYLTISELFRSHTKLVIADPIKLVCDLHKSFLKFTGSEESLDHFYSWGQIMLSDFDDIDKNLADASNIFKNVNDIHELDDISYLSEEQIEMLKRFFSNFNPDKSTELKRRFLTLWNHFHDIYVDFNSRLASQGMAYEGALYRKVVSDENLTFEYDRYIFVGFNLLQRVEHKFFKRLKNEKKAFFYWDFDHYYMPDPKHQKYNEAGYYISSYLSDFPNELDIHDSSIYGNFTKPKDITYISAPTENIQAVYAADWLRQGSRIADGRKTAVVLCNEGLLQAVVHNIPQEASKVNITTGYPLAQSPFCSLVSMLLDLRTDGFVTQRGLYRLRYVNKVLKHPYITYISSLSNELFQELNGSNRLFFISADLMSKDDGLKLLFSPFETTGRSFTCTVIQWLLQVIKHIAGNAADTHDQFFQESLFRIYSIANRLYGLVESGDLTVDIVTLRRLMRQVLQTSSIPFHGEPAEGVQFMGVLETRNIDFDHLLVLSCNEGNMPKGVNDTSFIPYSIRKAHGLTTIDHKVAIYAYYFYRLLQRAKDVTLVYNNSADGTSTGEMSRFMLQIMIESQHSISRRAIVSGVSTSRHYPSAVEKTPEVMQRLHLRFDRKYRRDTQHSLLTPTSINTFFRCQLRFYYKYVLGLMDNDESDNDTIDSLAFGSIFHKSAEEVYLRMKDSKTSVVTKESIQHVLHADDYLTGVVEKYLDEVVYNLKQNRSSRPEYNGLQLINIKVITRYLKQLLNSDLSLAPFTLVSLEQPVKEDIKVRMGNSGEYFLSTLGGFVDRIDIVEDNGCKTMRVVDYKTGGSRVDSSKFKTVDDIFTGLSVANHADYYLQAIAYSNIVRHSATLNPSGLPVAPALQFVQHNQTSSPVLCLDKHPITDVKTVEQDFRKNLDMLLTAMFDPEQPFQPVSDKKNCASCPYYNMCY